MTNCPDCKGELEFASQNMYARCKGCGNLFMSMNGAWQPYPVDASVRPMIEQSLGFTPSAAAAQPEMEPPKECLSCKGTMEVARKDGVVMTRCSRCGILSQFKNGGLIPIVVNAPGSNGWNGEFQAIFEENLGFTKKIRKNPPGIPE